MKDCLFCKKPHSKEGGFCSRACANKARPPRTAESRAKTSQSVRTAIALIPKDIRIGRYRKGVEAWKRSMERKKKWREALVRGAQNLNKKRHAHAETLAFEQLRGTEIRIRILSEQGGKCALCKTDPIWNEKPLKFELDHIDGNKKNESRRNLRLICPNCHSQTETYRGRNNGTRRVKDEVLIETLQKSTSVYKTLVALNMNLAGGNYTRVRNLIKKHNLKLPYLAI